MYAKLEQRKTSLENADPSFDSARYSKKKAAIKLLEMELEESEKVCKVQQFLKYIYILISFFKETSSKSNT